MKKGFVLYRDQYEPVKGLSREQKGDLLDAIFQYQRDGTEPEQGSMVALAFSFFKITFERDQGKYLEKCEKNKENARMRWDKKNANACERIKVDANHADRGSGSERESGSGSESGTKEHIAPPVPETEKKKAPRKVFKPPTVEEVAAYCTERKNTVDPEAFVNFYESKGWFVGKNKMKAWKAAVGTWEKNSFGSGKNKISKIKKVDYGEAGAF